MEVKEDAGFPEAKETAACNLCKNISRLPPLKAASWESHPRMVLMRPPPLRCLWLDGSIIITLACHGEC